MNGNELPKISLQNFYDGSEADRRALGKEVDDALCTLGFFVLVDHRIPSEVLRKTAEQARRFFDLPLALKTAYYKKESGSARGYQPPGEISLSYTRGEGNPPDLIERFGIGPEEIPVESNSARRFYVPNIWPSEPANFRDSLLKYYAELARLSQDLLTIFATALHIPPDFFASYFVGHNSTLRLNNYPEQLVPPQPGQIRAGAHTDYGGFTLLMVDDAPGGLQVRTQSGKWMDVAAPAESFVINIGDLMMYWTNDRWLSNLHRVVNPPIGATGTRRQSIGFFANPRDDTLIECIETCVDPNHPRRHPPVVAGEHRQQKIRAAGEQNLVRT